MAEGDYRVADISLADFGRKEIELAEHEVSMRCHRRQPRQTTWPPPWTFPPSAERSWSEPFLLRFFSEQRWHS